MSVEFKLKIADVSDDRDQAEMVTLDDVGLRRRFGRAGREVVLGGFEESIVLRDTLAIYQELIPEFPVSRFTQVRSDKGEGGRN